ncbi:MAG: tRNA (uridine(34)/cytosine(34)/5-carboxymethylaminomethyluridine(34)-2'-O)-methyltransferase TrmL [Mycoplasmataceae bacterium]|nr:tRNA (uridine(34)/cytosine(34)/5-carboxymethylaminomethyluridine(34)-2'-O)-methyltransferase TrmL [Mycoplasmataceae bacterium]
MLHIVLYEPEIPENTGNIARTCVGFNAKLHLIRPYGFFITDKTVKRAGVDYWDKLQLEEHDCWDDFLKSIKTEYKIYFLTRYGVNTPDSCGMKSTEDVYLIFGKESTGIPKEILRDNKDKTVRIPTSENVRSLNLSNCVAMLTYEFAKQNDYEGLKNSEPHKPLFDEK